IFKRDEINKEHESYYIRTEGLMTLIVPHANAMYEIVNRQYYTTLKELTYYQYPSYTCDLDFNLKEIVLKIGALNIRPSCIPTPENFPSYKARHSNTPFKQ